MLSGEALRQPTDLNRFMLITYADLKHYTFFYWYAVVLGRLMAAQESGLFMPFDHMQHNAVLAAQVFVHCIETSSSLHQQARCQPGNCLG